MLALLTRWNLRISVLSMGKLHHNLRVSLFDEVLHKQYLLWPMRLLVVFLGNHFYLRILLILELYQLLLLGQLGDIYLIEEIKKVKKSPYYVLNEKKNLTNSENFTNIRSSF